MIPNEEAGARPEPSPGAPGRIVRRSRRGGRRHSRNRGRQAPGADSRVEPAAPQGETAPVESELESGPVPEAKSPPPSPQGSSGISRAIEQVSRILEELRHALDEMDEVLETLEFAERQKIDDEREIESLQRALRKLHRPAHYAPERPAAPSPE